MTPPVNALPGPQFVAKNTALVFSTANGNAISVSDVDANGNPEQVTLAATNGTLTLSGKTGLTFSSGSGTGNASMTFTGTLADINTALNGLRFDPMHDYGGDAGLAVTTNDLGNTGAGGLLSASGTVTISVGVPGINVNPMVGLVTTEAGGQATFTVVLATKPKQDVTIPLHSSNTPPRGRCPPRR